MLYWFFQSHLKLYLNNIFILLSWKISRDRFIVNARGCQLVMFKFKWFGGNWFELKLIFDFEDPISIGLRCEILMCGEWRWRFFFVFFKNSQEDELMVERGMREIFWWNIWKEMIKCWETICRMLGNIHCCLWWKFTGILV